MSSKVSKIEPSILIGYDVRPTKSICKERDAILYALGIGFSKDPLKDDELQYTYERHDNFKVFPTFSTCLHNSDLFEVLTDCPGIPEFNPMMILHGEQHMRMLRPLVSDREYRTKGKIVDVADKGKGCLVSFEILTYEIDQQGKEHLAVVQISSSFIRGLGGFGFKGKNDQYEQIGQTPKRKPDRVASDKTTPNQAIIYRLSGDLNPLHIDQNMSSLGGFKVPILHGLCSYGISAKLVIQTFCNGDSDRLKSIAARFTSHVFPGETLVVSMWKEGSRIYFTAKTQERGLDVVVGQIDIDEKPKL